MSPASQQPEAAHAATSVGQEDRADTLWLTPAGRFWLPYIAVCITAACFLLRSCGVL